MTLVFATIKWQKGRTDVTWLLKRKYLLLNISFLKKSKLTMLTVLQELSHFVLTVTINHDDVDGADDADEVATIHFSNWKIKVKEGQVNCPKSH